MNDDPIISTDFPEWYINFISSYPEDLAQEFFDLGWEKEYIASRQLLSQWPAVLELNLDLRRPDGTEWHQGGPWPTEFLGIGDDRCGNYYCIKLGSDDQAIYFYNHDIGEFELEHDTIQKFVSELQSQAAEFREQDA